MQDNQQITLDDRVSVLSEQVERLAIHMEKANFADYVQLLNRPRRMIFYSLVGGIARGVGLGIGFSVLGATLVYLLQKLQLLGLPLIGDYIAELVRIVQSNLGNPYVR
ncbi:hypothetical protein CIG75_13075 [Tumebacillus algifaecis]|uniref:Signal transduction histidine kinase n=1 Tax=Tumebacillus algifaecis TaxID=1214604 RepID=A0A223D6N1_9BACL|nr:hypothetical protein CIG75_13075 [Tumebacillus algifaecis]